MPARELPSDLVAVLRRARDVELAATTKAQRSSAIAATGRLLLACVDAGWRIYELVPALGLDRRTLSVRIGASRSRGETAAGLEVAPPPRRLRRADIVCVPVEEREWLTVYEAADLAGVSAGTVARWRRVGVLPNTMWVTTVQPLYLRADLLRVAGRPRWRNGALDLRSVQAEVAGAGPE